MEHDNKTYNEMKQQTQQETHYNNNNKTSNEMKQPTNQEMQHDNNKNKT